MYLQQEHVNIHQRSEEKRNISGGTYVKLSEALLNCTVPSNPRCMRRLPRASLPFNSPLLSLLPYVLASSQHP